MDGFWSLTMYDKDYFFVDNPLNRHTLSQRNKFKTNADGSVDLYIRPNRRAGQESNWLPAPKDEFMLMMRLYWPKEKPPSLIDGSWRSGGQGSLLSAGSAPPAARAVQQLECSARHPPPLPR